MCCVSFLSKYLILICFKSFLVEVYRDICVCDQDARKKREDERQKQLRWREEHRSILLQDQDSGDEGGGGDDGPGGPGGAGGGGQAQRQQRWHKV